MTVSSTTAYGGANIVGTQTTAANDDIISSDDGLNLNGITQTNIATLNLDTGNYSGTPQKEPPDTGEVYQGPKSRSPRGNSKRPRVVRIMWL